jgi:putative transposase
MAEAFRWSVTRRVTKTATVSLLSNRYQVGPELVGKAVELRSDPEDLSKISVYLGGDPAGEATPFVIGRHVHPSVAQAAPLPPPPEPGADYMALVAAAHAEALGEGSISYKDLTVWGPPGEA